MGRGSNQHQATPALRVLEGGQQGLGREACIDPTLDRLWLTRSKDLTLAARALAKVGRLGGPQRSALIRRLNSLSVEVGLAPRWQLIEQPGVGGRSKFSPALPVEAPAGPLLPNSAPFVMLQDEFDGGLIDGMPEGRYLGRRLCELPQMISEQFAPTLAASVR